jgi:hypothetical protein
MRYGHVNENLAYIGAIQDNVRGIVGDLQQSRSNDTFEKLKSGEMTMDKIGSDPVEQAALQNYKVYDIEQMANKYAGMDFDQLLGVNPSKEANPLHATMAYAKVLGDYAKTDEVKRATLSARFKMAEESYRDFDAGRNLVNQYIANGQLDMAGNAAAQTLKNSKGFYSGEYDPKKKVLNLYRASMNPNDMGKEIKFVEAVPVADIGKRMNEIQPEQYVKQTALSMMAASVQNRDAANKPVSFYNPETKDTMTVIPIIDLNNLSNRYFRAYDSRGNETQIPNVTALMNMGYKPIGDYIQMAKGSAEVQKIQSETQANLAKAFKYKSEGVKNLRGDDGKAAGAKKATNKEVLDWYKTAYPADPVSGQRPANAPDLDAFSRSADTFGLNNAKDGLSLFNLMDKEAEISSMEQGEAKTGKQKILDQAKNKLFKQNPAMKQYYDEAVKNAQAMKEKPTSVPKSISQDGGKKPAAETETGTEPVQGEPEPIEGMTEKPKSVQDDNMTVKEFIPYLLKQGYSPEKANSYANAVGKKFTGKNGAKVRSYDEFKSELGKLSEDFKDSDIPKIWNAYVNFMKGFGKGVIAYDKALLTPYRMLGEMKIPGTKGLKEKGK